MIRRLIGLDTDDFDPETAHLTPAQHAALKALRADVEITATEIAATACIAPSTARNALLDLEKQGLAQRRRPPGTDNGRAHHQWRLAP